MSEPVKGERLGCHTHGPSVKVSVKVSVKIFFLDKYLDKLLDKNKQGVSS